MSDPADERPAGILAVAARVPALELSADTVDRAHGRPPGRGSRRSAAYDDDAVTLAADAAQRCLANAPPGFDRKSLRALHVASTTWPRSAGPQAERIAAALDLAEDVEVSTFGGSWRCGAAALRVALACSRGPALVVAADRLEAPTGSDGETSLGDGAAAVLVGDAPPDGSGPGARVLAWKSLTDGTDWASQDARFLAVSAARLASRAPREGATRAAVTAPGARPTKAAAAAVGLPCVDGAMDRIGFCGAAHPLLALVQALEGGKAGERVLFLALGDGVEAAVLEVVAPLSPPTFEPALAGGKPVTAYARWLASRTFFERPEARSPFASAAMDARDAEWLERLHGARCPACGATHVLPAPSCGRCGSAEAPARVALGRTGTVFTFTHEWYVPTPTPPVTMAVVDLDGGGRILVQAADAAPEEVQVGTPVRLALRRIHAAGGVPRYYWKAVPR